jgi:hypothetical protein
MCNGRLELTLWAPEVAWKHKISNALVLVVADAMAQSAIRPDRPAIDSTGEAGGETKEGEAGPSHADGRYRRLTSLALARIVISEESRNRLCHVVVRRARPAYVLWIFKPPRWPRATRGA